MTDKKITDLAVAAAFTGGEPFEAVQTVGGTPTSVQGTAAAAAALGSGAFIDPTTTDLDLIIRKSTTVTGLTVGFIGDSITAGTVVTTAPPTMFATDASKGAVTVAINNQGVSGATSAMWAPPGGTYYAAAKSAFLSAGVKLVHVMLGTNDAKTAVATTQSAFRANLLAMCDDLIASGMLVAISYPPFLNATTGVFDATSPARVLSYCAAIDSLIDNNHIFRGDTLGYGYFKNNLTALQADGVHPTQAGSDHLAELWAGALAPIINGLSNNVVFQRAVVGTGLALSQVGGVWTLTSSDSSALGLQESIRASFTGAAAGAKKSLYVPRGLKINSVEVLADVAGSLALDIWAAPYASYPPTSANSICAGALPTLSSAQKYKDSALTGWTTTLADDSTLIVNVNSVATIGAFEVVLTCTKLPPGSGPVVTWNPSDKEANFALSGGNLTVTRSGGTATWGGIRATYARDAATANHYFQFTAGNSEQMIGVANASENITTAHFIGGTVNGWSHYSSAGKKINNNVQTAYGVTWTTGDKIGCLLKNGKLYFRKNGTWMNGADIAAETGWAFSGLTGPLFPAMSLFANGTVCTANFSTADIGADLPATVSAWGS